MNISGGVLVTRSGYNQVYEVKQLLQCLLGHSLLAGPTTDLAYRLHKNTNFVFYHFNPQGLHYLCGP